MAIRFFSFHHPISNDQDEIRLQIQKSYWNKFPVQDKNFPQQLQEFRSLIEKSPTALHPANFRISRKPKVERMFVSAGVQRTFDSPHWSRS